MSLYSSVEWRVYIFNFLSYVVRSNFHRAPFPFSPEGVGVLVQQNAGAKCQGSNHFSGRPRTPDINNWSSLSRVGKIICGGVKELLSEGGRICRTVFFSKRRARRATTSTSTSHSHITQKERNAKGLFCCCQAGTQ
jgi:hypothetical protein